MAKLYRRSWEKWVVGRAGAISSPLAARSGTDGAITSPGYTASGSSAFTSATASFISTDVGRKIRLTGTPNKRFDGLFVIDAINSSTSVNLRYNHNVTGAVASPARFFETGSSITWRIMESCTFTADVANDIQGWHPGSYMNIEGATNVGNRGQWLISHVITNQTCILSKGSVFWVADGGVTNYATFFGADGIADGFAIESGLQWSITDREPMIGIDAYMLTRQQLIDSGWQVWQTRGGSAPSGSTAMLDDTILRSVGETDAALPNGKLIYLRMCCGGLSRSSQGIWGSQVQVSMSTFLHWDITGTAGGTPGNGLAPLRANPANTTSNVPTQQVLGSNQCDLVVDGAGIDLLSPGRAGGLSSPWRRDYVMISDADEFYFYWNNNLITTGAQIYGLSSIKPIGQNQNTVAITAATTGSGPYTINTGTTNIASLGYQVGDNICIRGVSTSPAEYLETTIITSFDTTDPLNNKVLVQTLSQVYGQGTDSVRGFIGEDPFPIVQCYSVSGGSFTVRSHNSAKLNNVTGKDWDATNFGTTVTLISALSTFTELIPNRRTGRFGIAAIHVKDSTRFEFRGRWRYLFVTNTEKIPQGKKLQNPVDGSVYIVTAFAISGFSNQGFLFGPIPKLQAGVR